MFPSSVEFKIIEMSDIFLFLNSTLKLAKFIRQVHPDIVILHSSKAGFIGRIAGMFCSSSIRFFYIPHCIALLRPRDNRLVWFVVLVMEQIAGIKHCGYVACSSSEYAVIRRYLPMNPCYLVENMVRPFRKVFPAKAKLSTKRIVTVGQIRRQKNPKLFIDIAQMAMRIFPELEFIWIGDGDVEMRVALEEAGIKVTGWTDQEGVFQQLSQAELYLSCSHWEGLPVSIIEAMYIGLPVLAHTCVGNVDVIRNQETGWLFNTASDAMLRIEEWYRNPEKFNIAAQQAKDETEKRFSKERYQSDLSALFAVEDNIVTSP
jgi:glycosyltransferase involved in cell wall biosynthesis